MKREGRMQNAECRRRSPESWRTHHVSAVLRSSTAEGGRFTFHVSRFAPQRACRAFTMIEIALSLAVIGFALVAIIGVLPVGLNVQRENREDTIINQEASVFMNAIRNGARGMDDLASYVVAITNYQALCRADGQPKHQSVYVYTQSPLTSNGGFALTNGFRIVGLLSTPKYVPLVGGGFVSNYVVAAIRSLSGPASEKSPQNNALMQDLAFSYRMISEVVPYGTSYVSPNWTNPMPLGLQANLHEVRLTFRWPLAKGTNALGRQVYRTVVGGSLIQTNEPWLPTVPLFFFQPQTYVKAP